MIVTKRTIDKITEITSRVDRSIAEMSLEQQSLLFCELSIIAYLELPDANKWAKPIGFTKMEQVQSANGIAYILSNDIDVVVAFRGLDIHSLDNIEASITSKMVNDDFGKVNIGFKCVIDELWPDIETSLTKHRTKQIWLTGHSMGGAMATIVSARMSRSNSLTISKVVTFGEPRCGNVAFTFGVTTQHIRWVNHHDIVPRIPTKWMGYQHCGTESYIGSTGSIDHSLGGRIFRFLSRIFDKLSLDGLDDHSIFNYRSRLVDALSKKAQ